MILLSTDPGDDFANGLFDGGRLIDATFRAMPERVPKGFDVHAIELPVIYPHSPVPPADIVALAISAGRLAERASAPSEQWLAARRWKGSTPKHIVEQRVWEVLDPRESILLQRRLELVPRSMRHNVIEAVAIGLFTLHRLPR